jgi:imidazole glycerol-phosphate synthase subunit HisH
MPGEIVIIDYGMGNLRSVEKKINHLKYPVLISSDPEVILKAEKLILPGVGHFANGMRRLAERNLIGVLNEKVCNEKIPILGICLGLQLFSSHSEEGDVPGLCWINANTVKFSLSDVRLKVPHMGWNSVNLNKPSCLFQGISNDDLFYFVHSYHLKSSDPDLIIGQTEYGYNFDSYIEKENIFGAQFHPEKSHEWGELLLKNFIAL